MTYREVIEKYIKDNNIKRYLSSEEDNTFINELNLDVEDYDKFDPIETYNYIYAMDNEEIKELLCLIYECEFDIEINKDGTLNLIDMQGAYLGGVESYENFNTIMDICERLEGSYFRDYHGIDLYEYDEDIGE